MFAHALKQLNKQVAEVKNLQKTRVYGLPNRRYYSPLSFFDIYFEDHSEGRFKLDYDWPTFMASTYVLELDASRDLSRMAKVLSEDELSSRNLKKALLSVTESKEYVDKCLLVTATYTLKQEH